VLEASVEVCLEAEFANYWVVMAVYMCVDPVHALEDLSYHAWEGLWERNACWS
jgi:hypothetical protein